MRARLYIGIWTGLVLLAGCQGPKADFTSDVRYGKAPLTVHFTDASNPNGNPITAWAWTFGDGKTSAEQNPVHTYEKAGAYTVSLTVTNPDGANTARGTAYIVAGDMWAEAFGTAGDDYALGVCAREDGGYVLVGTTPSARGDMDLYVLKVDEDGNHVWSKTFGGTGDDVGEAVLTVPVANDKDTVVDNDDIVIAGWTTSFGKGNRDVYVLRLEADGTEIWTKTYGGTGADTANALAADGAGGFILCGESTSSFGDLKDLYLVKITGTGGQEWAKTYTGMTGPTNESGNAVITLKDGYLAAGYAHNGLNEDMYVVRTDAEGVQTWSKMIGGAYDDRAYALAAATDGECIVVGSFNPAQFTGTDLTAVRLDKNGKQVWARTFGGNRTDIGYAVLAKTTSDFVIAGVTASTTDHGEDVYLVRLNGAGETVWTRTFGGTGDDAGYALALAPDGGFVIAGETNSLGAGQKDVYVIRCNAAGQAPSAPQP